VRSAADATPESGFLRLPDELDLGAIREQILANGGLKPDVVLKDLEINALRFSGAPESAPAEDSGMVDPVQAELGIICDPEGVEGFGEGAIASVMGTTNREGTPAILVIYVTEDGADVDVVLLDAATCEVLDSA
jgi:hypothetical protein